MLAERLYDIRTKRRLERCFSRGLDKYTFNICQIRKFRSDFDKILKDTRVLTKRTVKFFCKGKILDHTIIHRLRILDRLGIAEFTKSFLHVIRQIDSRHTGKILDCADKLLS